MDALNLEEIRAEINKVDEELTKLLERRFDLVLKVAVYKKANNIAVFDAQREKRVIENCKSHLKNPKYGKHIEKLYHEIMDASKDIEHEEIKEI